MHLFWSPLCCRFAQSASDIVQRFLGKLNFNFIISALLSDCRFEIHSIGAIKLTRQVRLKKREIMK